MVIVKDCQQPRSAANEPEYGVVRRVRDNLGGVVDTLQATLDDYRAHENVATAAIRGVGA